MAPQGQYEGDYGWAFLGQCDYTMSALKILDPLAQSLIDNSACGEYGIDQILHQLKILGTEIPKTGNRDSG